MTIAPLSGSLESYQPARGRCLRVHELQMLQADFGPNQPRMGRNLGQSGGRQMQFQKLGIVHQQDDTGKQMAIGVKPADAIVKWSRAPCVSWRVIATRSRERYRWPLRCSTALTDLCPRPDLWISITVSATKKHDADPCHQNAK